MPSWKKLGPLAFPGGERPRIGRTTIRWSKVINFNTTLIDSNILYVHGRVSLWLKFLSTNIILLRQSREFHAAMVVTIHGEDTLIVLGGGPGKGVSRRTGEIVNSMFIWNPTELITQCLNKDQFESPSEGGQVFTLQTSGAGACATSYQGGFVMIGGQHVESNQVTSKQNHGKVDRWVGIQYFLPPRSQVRLRRQLPRLSARPSWSKVEARLHHLRISKWDRGLKENLSFPLCCFVKQILLVAGGIDQNDKYLSSVELLLPNQQWTKGGDLPRHWCWSYVLLIGCWWCFTRAISGLKAGILDQKVVVTGGIDRNKTYHNEVVCGRAGWSGSE